MFKIFDISGLSPKENKTTLSSAKYELQIHHYIDDYFIFASSIC